MSKNAVIEEREVTENELEQVFDEERNEEESQKAADVEADMDAVSAAEKILPEFDFIVPLRKEYSLDGTIIKKIDLSRMADFTTMDAQEIERAVAKLGGVSAKNKYRDPLYVKHIAMRATGYPVEFFNNLNWKDMDIIIGAVSFYFLFV